MEGLDPGEGGWKSKNWEISRKMSLSGHIILSLCSVRKHSKNGKFVKTGSGEKKAGGSRRAKQFSLPPLRGDGPP